MHVNIKEKTIMFSETTRVEGEEQEHFTQLEQEGTKAVQVEKLYLPRN